MTELEKEFSAKGFANEMRRIDREDTVEAEPVKHGRWIKDKRVYGFSRCSECGSLWEQTFVDNLFTKYCPRCGARMDGEENG